ncbi:hypothetical protein HK102_012982, partial [Quaeritorhiza haematococci]
GDRRVAGDLHGRSDVRLDQLRPVAGEPRRRRLVQHRRRHADVVHPDPDPGRLGQALPGGLLRRHGRHRRHRPGHADRGQGEHVAPRDGQREPEADRRPADDHRRRLGGRARLGHAQRRHHLAQHRPGQLQRHPGQRPGGLLQHPGPRPRHLHRHGHLQRGQRPDLRRRPGHHHRPGRPRHLLADRRGPLPALHRRPAGHAHRRPRGRGQRLQPRRRRHDPRPRPADRLPPDHRRQRRGLGQLHDHRPGRRGPLLPVRLPRRSAEPGEVVRRGRVRGPRPGEDVVGDGGRVVDSADFASFDRVGRNVRFHRIADFGEHIGTVAVP